MTKKKTKKLSFKERAACYLLTVGIPFLLEKWRACADNITFDEFCKNLLEEIKK